MQTIEIKEEIQRNALEITRLHNKVHETFGLKDRSSEHKLKWHMACKEFHSRFDELSFPGGGFKKAFQRIAVGDSFAIEVGLCFLEIRPYFFRSGYMYRALIPKIKKANLSLPQQKRFDVFMEKYRAWRKKETLRKESQNSS